VKSHALTAPDSRGSVAIERAATGKEMTNTSNYMDREEFNA